MHGGNAAAYVGRADALRLEKLSKRRQGIQILPHLTGAKLDFPNFLGLELEHGVNQCLHPRRRQAERVHTTSHPVLYGAARILDLGDRVACGDWMIRKILRHRRRSSPACWASRCIWSICSSMTRDCLTAAYLGASR